MRVDRVDLTGEDVPGPKILHLCYFTEFEALEMIQSLTAQLINRNPNTNRKEWNLANGHYFTAFVQFEEDSDSPLLATH